MPHFFSLRPRRTALLSGALSLLAFAGLAQSGGRTWTDAHHSGPGAWAKSSWVDARGATYVVGSVSSAAALPGLPPLQVNSAAGLLAKAAPDGTWRWSRTAVGTTPFPAAYAFFDRVVGDGHGGLYVTGSFRGTVTLNSIVSLTSTPNSSMADGLVIRYDTAGNLLWARQLAWPDLTGAESRVHLAVDSAGDATVAFLLEGRTTLDSFQLQAVGRDVVVARLNRQGAWQWTAMSSGTADEDPVGLGVDAAGNAYVTGTLSSVRAGLNTDSVAQFGTTRLHVYPVSVGGSIPLIPYGMFAARVSAQGQWQWATQALGGEAAGLGVAVAPGGEAYVLVDGGQASTFGPLTPVAPLEGGGVVLARLSAAGQWEWVRALNQAYTGGAANGAGMDLRLVLTPAGHPCLLGVVGAVTKLDGVPVLADTLRPASPRTYHVGAIQLDGAGQLEWAVIGRGAGYISHDLGMAGGGVEPSGRVTFVGSVLDSLTLGPVVLTNPAVPPLVGSVFIAHIGPAVTGLSTAAAGVAAELFPNPIRRGQSLTLDLPTTWAGARVEVLNVLGQVVSCLQTFTPRTALPTAYLPAGCYSVRVSAAGQHLTRRLIVAE